MQVFLQLQLQVEVPGSLGESRVLTTQGPSLALSLRGNLWLRGQAVFADCLGLRQNQRAAPGHLLDLYCLGLGKLNSPPQ